MALDAHENIEFLLFNPSRSRQSAFRRSFELVFKYVSAARRMHNKNWIVNGAMAIVGGRNIGDAYFDAATVANFRDADVALTGPTVSEAAAIFERYWTSEPSVGIRTLHPVQRSYLGKLEVRLERVFQTKQAQLHLARTCGSEVAAKDEDGFVVVGRAACRARASDAFDAAFAMIRAKHAALTLTSRHAAKWVLATSARMTILVD